MVLFWQAPSVFSQWTPSIFTVDGVEYSCGEQFFAAAKARLFGDQDTLRRIMRVSDPIKHKRYGRQVKGFDEAVWERERENVVRVASYYKFSQNPAMRQHLLGTGDKMLVEASPFDAIWGIGHRADDPAAIQPSLWRGSNLLGKSLQVVRDLLREHAPTPTLPPQVSSDAQLRNTIHEVNPETQERISTAAAEEAAPSSGYRIKSAHVPRDHSAEVLAVTSAEYNEEDRVPLLAEHGPCLVGGVVTVDDASFTTRVKIHAGPAKSQYGCAALLDSGSPATFINSNAVGTLKAMGAISEACISHGNSRSWGGFGKSESLQTSDTVRLSVQFFHGDTPSASLAVWAHIVPANTMQFPILLGRDSFMRFNTRTYRMLPPRPLDNRVFGEYTLAHQDDSGAVAYVPDFTAPADQFQLRYAGPTGTSLSDDHQMIEVNLVRSNGTPALTGQYLVDMLPDVSSNEEIFVSDGRQFVPLAGAAELEPGDLLGTAAAPLMRVPVEHLEQQFSDEADTSCSVPGPILGSTEDNANRTVDPQVRCHDPFVHNLRSTDPPVPDPGKSSPAAPAPAHTSPSPPPQHVMERLSADQRVSFESLWNRLPPHLKLVKFDLHGPGWSPEVITELGDLLHDFQDVFSTSSTDLGSCSLMPFEIKVPPDCPPVTSKPYRMNPLVAKQVDAILDQYLAAGLIQHSTSPYSSPIVVIPKKSGGIRITVNYKKLNHISSFGQLPIPRVDEILTKLNRGSIFSLFDFTGSFHQITVHKDTIPLTAFATPTRLFEWLRMPMGASQSAGHFVKVINEVIKGLDGVEAYLDDVVVFDEGPLQHVRNMRTLFERLRKYDLKLSPSKATIGTTKADFLGHTISSKGVLPNARKVAALAGMPMPTTVKQLRSLMGGLSYYRRFLRDMAKRVKSITHLLKKGVPFAFTSDMETIVRSLLAELAKPPILVFPDWDAIADGTRPLRLCCDASSDGLGAALEQEQKDGSVRPIVFISRATLDAERNWTALDLEAGAVVWAIKRLREYLRGTHFRIYSDNKALESLSKISEHNPRVQRWIEFLQAYSYTLEYRRGASNGNADMLSRLPIEPTAADINGNSSLTSPEDVGVYLIRATGHATPGQTTPGVGLGGLAPPSENAALGGLPSDDFADFRKHGPRMRIDDLDDPAGEFVARVFPYVNARGPLRHLADDRALSCTEHSVFAVPEVISAATQQTQGAVPALRSSASPVVSPMRPLYRDTATVYGPSVRPYTDTAAFALPVHDTQTADDNSRLPPVVSPATATVDAGSHSDRLDAADSLPPPSTSRLQPHRIDPSELTLLVRVAEPRLLRVSLNPM